MKKNAQKTVNCKNLSEENLQLFHCWLRKQGCSEATIGQYLGICRKFGRYLHEHHVALDDVHDGHVDTFLSQLKVQRGSLEESRRYHRTGIDRLVDYLYDVGICQTPFTAYLDGYASQLREHGYTEKTIAQYVSTCCNFGRYLRRKGIELDSVSEDEFDSFLQQLPLKRARKTNRARILRDYRRRLWLFLNYLRVLGECPLPKMVAPTEPACVTEYLTFLQDHRGLTANSIDAHRRYLMRFLVHAGIEGTIEQLRSLSVRQADEYLIEAARNRDRKSMSALCATVRGFFKFLYLRGILLAELHRQVTTPRIYQHEGVPRSISWSDVEKTLKNVDRDTLTGRRDYAIMVILAYYGLRACEVATLLLSDLDWRNDVFFVKHAKGGGVDVLPLLPIVGDAIIGYLQFRPPSKHPEIFLKIIAPSGPISSASVSWVARKYLLAAGVVAPFLGSHTFRHSHAVRLLRAGFHLKTIGDTLGHRNPQSTFIYAKAATEDLRSVALDIEKVRP
jgi:site-specific recombinase XerD